MTGSSGGSTERRWWKTALIQGMEKTSWEVFNLNFVIYNKYCFAGTTTSVQ